MERFRSSYRRLRLDAESSAPPNPYAQALRSYQQARESGIRALTLGGGLVVLLAAIGLFWGGRLSVHEATAAGAPVVAAGVPAPTAEESVDATTIAISQSNANLLTQIDEANRDRAQLQALLARTRENAETEASALRSTIEETRDLASIWVDHAQASLRLLRDRLIKLRDQRLMRIDPYLHQLLDRPSTDTEVALRQYLELLALETEGSELDAIEDLRRDCLRQVSGHNLDRADLPTLFKDLREVYSRLARAEAHLDAGDTHTKYFANLLIDPDASGIRTPREMRGTDSPWFQSEDRAQAMVKQWIAEEGPLHFVVEQVARGSSYRRLLREFRARRVSLAVPYEGGFVVVSTLDFESWNHYRRRLEGHPKDRTLMTRFREYYQFAFALPRLRDLDLFVSTRETFEPIETR